jgi:hypothetical protein
VPIQTEFPAPSLAPEWTQRTVLPRKTPFCCAPQFLCSSFLPEFLFVDFPGAVFHSCWITSFGACGPASSSIARVLLALGCLPLRVLGLFTAARARCLLPALLLLLDSLPPVLIFGSCARAFWFFSCRSVSAVQAPS